MEILDNCEFELLRCKRILLDVHKRDSSQSHLQMSDAELFKTNFGLISHRVIINEYSNRTKIETLFERLRELRIVVVEDEVRNHLLINDHTIKYIDEIFTAIRNKYQELEIKLYVGWDEGYSELQCSMNEQITISDWADLLLDDILEKANLWIDPIEH